MTGAQLVANPGGFKALKYEFFIEFCFNSQRDIVKAIPWSFAGGNLPESERQAGLPVGSVGSLLITGSSREGPVIRLGDRPIRADLGERYTGKVTIDFTFTPNGGAVQTYRASATIIIDRFGATTPPTVLDRI